MENKKYILTDETIKVNGNTLHRIKAIKDFGTVKAGDLGGFVESEDNLSHSGNCWIYDDACVFERARVSDDARVYGQAHVYGKSCVYGQAHVYDQSRIYGEAIVFGRARVYGEALVFGKAYVYNEASIFGGAQVYGEAIVFGKAHVYRKAKCIEKSSIYGDASISSQYDILTIPNIGSRNDTTTFFKTKDNKIMVHCGCFRGTIDEFEKAVNERHKESEHALAYRAAITMAKTVIQCG